MPSPALLPGMRSVDGSIRQPGFGRLLIDRDVERIVVHRVADRDQMRHAAAVGGGEMADPTPLKKTALALGQLGGITLHRTPACFETAALRPPQHDGCY